MRNFPQVMANAAEAFPVEMVPQLATQLLEVGSNLGLKWMELAIHASCDEQGESTDAQNSLFA